ncbi:MAG: hypothetical protein MI723_06615, partial [Caulobacterales bacterium]|nr:hypothetical protein [Caulobacterales bacterium]
MRQLLGLTAATVLLAGAAAGEDAPVGQLDDRAEPIGYVVDLVVDPRQERFSGRAAIEVRINRPLTTLWLHGDELAVSEATYAPAGGEPVTAAYEQVLDTGVASLTFEDEIAAGVGELVLTYDAP